jgi:hypothetical protein
MEIVRNNSKYKILKYLSPIEEGFTLGYQKSAIFLKV